MVTFIIGVLVFCFGVLIGRAHEIGKQRQTRQLTEEQTRQQGYGRTRMALPQMMTLEETQLALWRLEGILGAVNDNFYDVKQTVGRYGAEDKPSTSKRTNAS